MAYYVFDTKTVWETDKYIQLRYIKTSPTNIKLTKLNKQTVPGSGLVGINGGYFDDVTQTVQSICIQNSSTVLGGGSSNFSGGYYNNDDKSNHINAGTLVWDPDMRTYRVQVISAASSLTISNPDNYWAQGGVSMKLQSDSAWNTMLNNNQEKVNDHFSDTRMARSALLYGSSLNIYLVMTPDTCTMSEFRDACKYIDPSNNLEGIFLDGNTASQMYVPGSYSFDGGANRKLPAMIQVVNNVQL